MRFRLIRQQISIVKKNKTKCQLITYLDSGKDPGLISTIMMGNEERDEKAS
jgi:hypothetical protein